MIALVQTINLDGALYMTECTYDTALPEGETPKTLHWFAQHPGSVDADNLMKAMDPGYVAQTRYAPRTIMRIMLGDYQLLSGKPPVYTPQAHIKTLRGAIAIARASDPELVEPSKISALEDHFTEAEISTMLFEMSHARKLAMKRKT